MVGGAWSVVDGRCHCGRWFVVGRFVLRRFNNIFESAQARCISDLDKLARWCAKGRIKLNPEKTKVIIFSKSRFAIRAEPALSLYGDLLSYHHQIKFLGITFDNRMTFTKHFEEILERCNQTFHRLRILVNKKWGPSPETILQIYKQCVRPILEYGIVSTITVSETVITKIQRVQNSFIRLALRLPKYVSARSYYMRPRDFHM